MKYAVGEAAVGLNLYKLRTADGRFQREIAEQARVTVAAYARYEQGKALPPLAVLLRLAKAFRVPVERLTEKTRAIPARKPGRRGRPRMD